MEGGICSGRRSDRYDDASCRSLGPLSVKCNLDSPFTLYLSRAERPSTYLGDVALR